MVKGVYIAGYASGAGKSSICSGLLDYLLTHMHIPPEKLAYIKPVTQCTAETSVTQYCLEKGIAHTSIGPVVFAKGTTKTEIMHPSNEPTLLEMVVTSVWDVADGKEFVIVDGMGYPSGGSCCGVGGGHVAQSLKLPVILVGTAGVGDAIDTNTLMRCYFERHGCEVVGVVFNKVVGSERHPYEDCVHYVSQYYQKNEPDVTLLGFIPKQDTSATTAPANDFVRSISSSFLSAVPVEVMMSKVLHRDLGPQPEYVQRVRQSEAYKQRKF